MVNAPGPVNRSFYPIIREAMAGKDYPAKTEIRIAFHRLPFSEQAALIAEHARQQVQQADSTIKMHWREIRNNLPPGVTDVWQKMVRSNSNPPAENIATFFPKLVNAADIASCLSDSYAFWAEKLYPYDGNGRFNYETLCSSAPRSFTHEQMGVIDRLSGLPRLGANLKGYADFLALSYGSLKIAP
jgi:hypothetical protein